MGPTSSNHVVVAIVGGRVYKYVCFPCIPATSKAIVAHKRFCLVSGWCSRVQQQTNLLFRIMTKTALPDLAGMVWYYTMFNDMFYLFPFILLAAIHIYIYTWNPNDPYFDSKRPSFGGFKPQNRGQTGSRDILYFIILYFHIAYVASLSYQTRIY